MIKKLIIRTTILMMSLLLLPYQALAQTSEERGLEIAKEVEIRNNGFGDFIGNMKMVLKNKHGQESIRNIRIKTLEVKNDGDKGLSIFEDPRDVKGTAFLTFSHKTRDDDQWLYLPALKRIKRISSRNKSGSFMGSEFSYEDISSEEVEKYTYKWLRDEKLNEKDCFVIESYPVDKRNSGYKRRVTWIDKDEYRAQRVEFYDRKNSLLKTLTFSNYELYVGKFWRAKEMHMVNNQTGKTTKLIWSGYKFKTGLKDSDFNKNSLKRAR